MLLYRHWHFGMNCHSLHPGRSRRHLDSAAFEPPLANHRLDLTQIKTPSAPKSTVLFSNPLPIISSHMFDHIVFCLKFTGRYAEF